MVEAMEVKKNIWRRCQFRWNDLPPEFHETYKSVEKLLLGDGRTKFLNII
jgi:DNA-binding ferritin-like protein (Dps family)